MPYKDLQKKREYNKRWMRNKHKIISDSMSIDNMNDYPLIKIPKNMKETQYPGYYITEDGKSYRKPEKCDKYEQYGKINEYGLIYLKPGFRGYPGRPEHQYECINISIRDENGKFLKQIKKSIHQLVAEVFVPNPGGHNEILHIDENNRNNHYKNLKWVTHQENMYNTNKIRIKQKNNKIIEKNKNNFIKIGIINNINYSNYLINEDGYIKNIKGK